MMLNKIINSNIVNDIKNDVIYKTDITIEINITNECNCNCKYCFEQDHGKKEINILEQNRQIKLLIDACEKFDVLKYNKLHIVFWGGEPMCNINFIKQIILATYEYEFVDYFMYSNGTLFNEFFQLVLSELHQRIVSRFHIQLSYDGEPHHTLMRGNNKDQIFRTAHLLIDNNYNINFKATLSFDMIKYFPECWKSYEELYNEFGDFVRYSPTLDTLTTSISNSVFNQWIISTKQIARYEYEFVQKHGYFLLQWFSPFFDIKASCNLNHHISINTDGNIYICHGCFYSKHANNFKISNTKNINTFYDILTDIFPNNRKLNQECKYCDAVFCNICHISQVDSLNYVNDWEMCKNNNRIRCKFFKYFGKINEALILAIMENKYGNM